MGPVKKTTPELRAEGTRLTSHAGELDAADIPDTADFSRAERGGFWRPVKRQVTLRLDPDLLDYLAGDGAGYRTRLNAALREWEEARRGR